MKQIKKLVYVFVLLATLICVAACQTTGSTYTVTFNSEGGSAVAAQTVDAGKAATKPANPTKDGYTFDKWLLDGSEYDFNTPVNANITLNASWLAGGTYKVTFYSDGSVYQEYSLREGETVTKPTDPTKEGYTFRGWYTDENFTIPYVLPNTMKNSDVNVYAGWRRSTQNTITFVTNCAATLNPLQKYEGETLNLDSLELSNPGYQLEGWYTDAEFTNKFTANTMPAENVTLYAKWISSSNVNVINVKYGDTTKTVFVDKSQTTVNSLEFDLANYVLEEWQDEQGNALTFPLTVVDGMTVVAKYYSDGLVVRRGILTGYTGLSTEVIIPTTFDGETITVIGNGESPFEASSIYKQITKIVIPEGVTKVDSNAFADLSGLEELILPASLTELGNDVFYGCTSLKTLDLSGNTTYPYENGVLYNKEKTTILKFIGQAEELVIAATIKEIASNAFAYADIKTLTIPATVETIGAYAFSNCKVETLNYAPNIDNVAEYSFKDCTSLKTVVLGANIKKIGTFAFSGCTSLTEIKLSTGTQTPVMVEGFAFEKCTSLTKFDFEDYTLADGTVFSFAGIESYTLADGLTEVPASMFINWTNLKSINIPASVTKINESAFYGCISLTNVNFAANSKLEVIAGKAFAYTAVETFDFEKDCPSLKEVYTGAFEGCTKTKTMTFPASMQYFQLASLAGLSYLENLTIPFAGSYERTKLLADLQAILDEGQYGLSDLGQLAYDACVAGEEAYIELVTNQILTSEFLFGYIFGRDNYENAVQVDQVYGTDGSYATFYVPSNLQNITVTGKYLSAYAFAGVDYLIKAPTVTSNMKVIGNRAVYYCENLEEIVLAEGVEKILESAFSVNMKLKKVVLPDTVNYIGYDAFYYAKALTELKLPYNKDLYIDTRAFYQCSNLGSVYQSEANKAPNTVNLEIGTFASYLFADNATITTAVLGKDAIVYCVDYTESLVEPYNSVFGSMLVLEVINLPSKIKAVHNGEEIDDLPGSFFYKLESLRQVNVEGKSIKDYYPTNTPSTYVLLPDGIDVIGYNSFYLTGAKNGIEVVVFPESAKSVKSSSFTYSGVIEIDMRHVTSLVGTVSASGYSSTPMSIFSNCTKLEKVILSSDLTEIARNMFANCTTLNTLGYYDAAEDKLYCDEGKFYISPKVTAIYNRAFNAVEGIYEIVLPEGLTEIDEGTFYLCKNLSKINIPASITNIGQMAFQECNLSEIVFSGNNVLTIGDAAFAYNTKVVEVVFPEGIISIGARIFDGCSSLEKVTIPSTCEEFGRSYAFRDCVNLKTIVLLGITPPNVDGGIMTEQTLFYNSKTGQRYSSAELKERGLKIYVPAQSLELYKYHRSTYGGYTRTITGWMIYYQEGLLEALEYGYYTDGTNSVQLDQDHNGTYLTTSGSYPAANRVKVTLDDNGSVTYEGYIFTFTTVDGYSTVTVNDGTETKTLSNVIAHYIDPAESERYSYIDGDKDGIVNKNVGYKDEVEEKTDYKVDRPIQFRNYLTLSANGAARFVVYAIGTLSTQPQGTSAEFCMDMSGHMPTVYHGSYVVNTDGTITVSISYSAVENEVEVEKVFTITVTNGQTNKFVANDQISYQFSRFDLFEGPMQ